MNRNSGISEQLRVFLCHSSGDKPQVRKLYASLKDDGFAPWLDEQDIIPGQNWREEISKAVRTCEVVVVCLSKKSITKEGYVQKEIKHALDSQAEKPDGTIYLIPLRLEEGVDVPERLSQWQWVNLFEHGGYQKLVRALTVRSSALGIASASELLVNSRTTLLTPVRVIEAHSSLVTDVVVTADGRAVSASFDKTLKVWDLNNCNELYTLQGHSGTVYSVAISPDGRRVVSASGDSTLKVWNLDRARN